MKKQYQKITDLVVKKLNEGVIPWESVTAFEGGGIPRNFQSQKEYRGINPFLLGMSGFESPNWLTFKQAKELGGHVKKGEKASPIFFFKMIEKEDEEYPMMQQYSVFNLCQIEGVEDTFKAPTFENNQKQDCEKFKNMKHLPEVIEGMYQTGSYSPELDKIKMPELKYCKTSDRYYKTLFHELAHATGHRSRLDRDLTGSFGSNKYGKEELIAEMSACMLSAKFGFVDKTIDCTASYVDNWLKAIKEDVSLVYQSAQQAQKACDYILKES